MGETIAIASYYKTRKLEELVDKKLHLLYEFILEFYEVFINISGRFAKKQYSFEISTREI